MKISVVVLAVLAGLSTSTITQAQNATSTESGQASTYRLSVVDRTTRAVKYERRSGSTKIASNDTAGGRQRNRRVELVVSGDVIGTMVGPASQNPPMTVRT